MGGFLADRLSKRTPRARALIPAFGAGRSAQRALQPAPRPHTRAFVCPDVPGAALGLVPFIGTMFLPNFYGSIACLFLEYLIAESWFGPAISLMQVRAVRPLRVNHTLRQVPSSDSFSSATSLSPQNELPAGVRGIAIAMYLFTATMVGNVAPLVIGALDPNTPVRASLPLGAGAAALRNPAWRSCPANTARRPCVW